MNPLTCISYAFAIISIVTIPVILAVFIRRMPGTMWRHFLFGALVFVIVQVVFRTPIVNFLDLDPMHPAIQLAVLALTAGVFEEVGRFVGYRLFLRRELKLRAGLMYGLGHGWIEGAAIAGWMALVLYAFVRMANFDLSAIEFSAEHLGTIREASTWWRPLVGAFERVAMLPIHMALALVVLQALRTGRARWLVAAVFAHSLINFGLAMVIRHVGLLQGELLAVVIAIMSVVVIREFLRQDHTGTGPLGVESRSSPAGTITRTG